MAGSCRALSSRLPTSPSLARCRTSRSQPTRRRPRPVRASWWPACRYQASRPASERTIIEWRSAYWILPWLIALILISWAGQYDGSPPTVFGVTLLSTHHLHQWVDLGVLAVVSLAIYYWAVNSGMSAAKVQAAVADVEVEASIELESHMLD